MREARAPLYCFRPRVVSVASVASAVYDQVSQLVPVQQVDDIDEVHQLDPVHQVDHKDECSKISCKKDTIRWTSQGSKKDFFQLCFVSPGEILGGLIFNRLSGGVTPLAQIRTAAAGGVYPPRAKIVLLLLLPAW